MEAERRTAEAGRRVNAVVGVLALCGIVVSLMQTLVIPLVPKLPELLHATPADTTWAVTATLLAGAVATPTMGRLGDMYGKRRMLLVSLIMLVAGSATGALSDSLLPMVAGRTLQGLAAGVIPLGISIMRDELPAERLGSATALMSASLGIGGALGLPAAAFLAERADWHILFWTAAGLGAVGFGLVLMIVPESQVRGGGRFDLVGAVGLSAALVCLLLAISKGADWGWAGGPTLGLLAAAVVVLLVWGAWELRVRQPLVNLRTTARRQVLLTNIASAVFGFAMFAMSLVLPQLIQLPQATGYGLGRDMLTVGLIMAPNGLVMMAMAPISARISATRGPKVTLMTGAVVVATGYGAAIVLMSAVWQLVLVSSIIGAGIGLAYGAMPALVMAAVPASETASANSLNTLMRSVGTSVSSAVAGVVLANLTITVGSAALPSQDGFRLVLGIGAGAAVIALAIAAFIPRRRRAVPPESPRDAAGTTSSPMRSVNGIVTGIADPARVVLSVTAHHADGAVLTGTTVDPSGRFLLENVPAEPLTLITTEHPAVRESVRIGAEPCRRHDIIMAAAQDAVAAAEPGGAVRLSPGGNGSPGLEPGRPRPPMTATVTGVVGSADRPLPGASLTLTDRAGAQITQAQTGADGRFHLAGLPAGSYILVASRPGCRPRATVVLADPARTAALRIELERTGTPYRPAPDTNGTPPSPATGWISGHTLVGSVTTGHRPVPGIRLTLSDHEGRATATTTTDAAGTYRFEMLDPGDYTITTQPPVPQITVLPAHSTTADIALTRRSAEPVAETVH